MCELLRLLFYFFDYYKLLFFFKLNPLIFEVKIITKSKFK